MNKKLIQYFWKNANKIVSREGVEMVLHKETTVEVSVMLRNHEEYENRIQVKTEFRSIEAFIETFNFKSPEDLARVSLKDLLLLNQKGLAQLDEMIYPA